VSTVKSPSFFPLILAAVSCWLCHKSRGESRSGSLCLWTDRLIFLVFTPPLNDPTFLMVPLFPSQSFRRMSIHRPPAWLASPFLIKGADSFPFILTDVSGPLSFSRSLPSRSRFQWFPCLPDGLSAKTTRTLLTPYSPHVRLLGGIILHPRSVPPSVRAGVNNVVPNQEPHSLGTP